MDMVGVGGEILGGGDNCSDGGRICGSGVNKSVDTGFRDGDTLLCGEGEGVGSGAGYCLDILFEGCVFWGCASHSVSSCNSSMIVTVLVLAPRSLACDVVL